VEEWLDLHFFRPTGFAVARWARSLRLTADHVTMLCLGMGLVGGNLLIYQRPWLNWLGVILLITSDILDSADGQLARMTGTSTKMGRMLDGLSDGLRFANMYVSVTLHAVLMGAPWPVILLGGVALLAHILQATVTDFIRQAYLLYGAGRKAELDLPQTVPDATGGVWRRFAQARYRDWVDLQARLFPATVALARRMGPSTIPPAAFRARYDELQGVWVERCWLIAQNIRFALIALAVASGSETNFFWLTLLIPTPALFWILRGHEQNAALLLAEVWLPQERESRVA
jgi:phosphatidylglycerophosphate synthase